jgi:hypothetical protein
MKRHFPFFAAVAMLMATVPVFAITPAEVKVKKLIADSMTASELQAYKVRMAEIANRRAADRAREIIMAPATPGDTCVAATPEIGTLPYAPAADTTVGAVDNFDLPADTTNPTCAVGATCTGAGPAGSLPFGAIYTGTGMGPDRAYRLVTDANCTLTIGATPTSAWDLALVVYQANCSSNLADCACVDDTGVAGGAESITLSAVAGTTYFVVIDGYSAGATPPGPSGGYNLNVTGTGCSLVTPVTLESFSVGKK